MAIKRTVLRAGLLAQSEEVVRETMIPYQWAALHDELPGAEPSHAIGNLLIAAGEKNGEYRGMVFQDSDVAKWLEAVAYRLASHPDPEWESKADSLIDLLGRAQQPDGYLNSYYTVVEPQNRWTNLAANHELYCAGHLIEAAVAYYEATGKDKLLQIVCKLVDHIDSVFGPEPGKKRGYPGHEEIELALIRLYRITRNPRHLNLARFFVEERGRKPHYFELEAKARGEAMSSPWGQWAYHYSQSHLPLGEQETVEGHSVRAMYLLIAAADLALETNDGELLAVCERLWNNVVESRMYLTGGIGSQEHGEGFTVDYDLPSDTAYAETCAAIGLFLFGQRMLENVPHGKYADVMERALYNGILSGMSVAGDRFFYVNPLEVSPSLNQIRRDQRHVATTRQGWFRCACCPPNLARLLASINRYLYSFRQDGLYVHFFAQSEVEFTVGEHEVRLNQATEYPWDEQVRLELNLEGGLEFALHLRLPGWCKQPEVKVNGQVVEVSVPDHGYLTLKREWAKGDTVELKLPMPVERVYANSKVRETVGRVALQRGPIVYCLEEVDNGPNLPALVLGAEPDFRVVLDPELGVPAILAKGYRLENSGQDLYTTVVPKAVPTEMKAVPYYIWDNRRPGEMLVWMTDGCLLGKPDLRNGGEGHERDS
ncbi:MAG: glycoside hydrolase family 127 protein [Firmicutes bacterium]|nr:glycoside hydrolase family 127 protein [Bacillota bacterium]